MTPAARPTSARGFTLIEPRAMKRRGPEGFTLIELPAVRRREAEGFTLIELLVVVAIIASLIAILLPSMNKARDAAKMAVDGSNLRQIAVAANAYATSNKMTYPSRDAYQAGAGWGAHSKPTIICKGADDRVKLKGYIPFTGVGNCPYSPEQLDYDAAPDTHQIEIDYALFYGHQLGPDDPGMMKMGDPMIYDGRKFYVLATDWETIDNTFPFVESSHNSGGAYPAVAKGSPAPFWISRWDLIAFERPPVNFNYAYNDGSVRALYNVTTEDDRLHKVPSSRYDNPAARWSQLPANR